MSLDKAISHNKEHRKPYRGAKAVDVSCRNHGGGHKYPCPYCEANRKHCAEMRQAAADEKLKEYFLNEFFDEKEETYEEYCYKWGFPY